MIELTKKSKQRGATTILLAMFVMNVILLIALTTATIIMYEVKMVDDLVNSIPAFYAADAGAEKCLYQSRLESGECATAGGVVAGVLSNGAQFSATRAADGKIISWGIYGQTKRQVELTW